MSTVDTTTSGREDAKARQQENREKIDFKMITFSLGGKEYGIDIMKVKEISKIERFTYVPNGSPHLRGVYNLRGDIIPIIDLRIMFHLSVKPTAHGRPENVIILNTEEQVMGIIVDSIDKVIGVSSQRIKPPHPLFDDINIQYISGVVEYGEFLYIVLDVERIFGAKAREAERPAEVQEEETAAAPAAAPAAAAPEITTEVTGESLELEFVTGTLGTFRGFTVTDLNVEWVRSRLVEWRELRSSQGLGTQLMQPQDADDFLESFYSPYTGEFWGDEYLAGVRALLPEVRGNVSVWNAGCGRGYETYSIAALLLDRYAGQRVKVWANDNDLLGISMAPTLVFHEETVPPSLRPFIVKGRNGCAFRQDVKDSILFEYHDILHPNPFPDVDLIVARDILSFFSTSNQRTLLDLFHTKLRPGGLLFIGHNERLSDKRWTEVKSGEFTAYERLAEAPRSEAQ